MNSLVKTFSIVALLFLFPFFCFSQTRPPTTITISLIVDTENFDPNDWNKSCRFKAEWADTGKVEYSSCCLRDFIVEGQVGDKIIWDGKFEEDKYGPNAVVNITEIYRKRWLGRRVFKQRRIGGKKAKGKNSKSVEAEAKKKTKKKPYEYDIYFEITDVPGINGKYKIDPKMKIMPRL